MSARPKNNYLDFQLDQMPIEELKAVSAKIDNRLFGETTIQDESAKTILTAGEVWDEAKEISRMYGTYQGLETGFPGIERLMGSFMPGELLILAGAPGKGKSLLAQNIMFNVVQQGLPVAFVSLEMQPSLALSRMQLMCETEAEEENLKSLLWFQEKQSMTDEEVGAFMTNAAEMGAALVVIDYLQFIPKSVDNERGEISRFVRHFKELANTHKLPTILISSINRKVEKGEKPDLDNLSESSVIEFTADMVGFVWRDQASDEMEFYIRKNRSRRLHTEPIHFKQTKWRLAEDHSLYVDPFEELK